jgi:hypothetical protein
MLDCVNKPALPLSFFLGGALGLRAVRSGYPVTFLSGPFGDFYRHIF